MSNILKKVFHSKSITKGIGRYPSCDHLNIALTFLLENPTDNLSAIDEILYAISKADGYLYDHVKEELNAIDFYEWRRSRDGIMSITTTPN